MHVWYSILATLTTRFAQIAGRVYFVQPIKGKPVKFKVPASGIVQMPFYSTVVKLCAFPKS